MTKRVEGWAWEIYDEHTKRWELCYWALPSRSDLLADGKPSSDARPVRIYMERVGQPRGRKP